MRDAAFDTPGTASAMSRRSPAMHAPLLDVRSLGFSAGGEKLLHDVDVAIRRGSRTLIMGPNGAGKSLLLRLMHGLLQPQEGAILWEGGGWTPPPDAHRLWSSSVPCCCAARLSPISSSH